MVLKGGGREKDEDRNLAPEEAVYTRRSVTNLGLGKWAEKACHGGGVA